MGFVRFSFALSQAPAVVFHILFISLFSIVRSFEST
jgi:hypothetical protein